jgi:hypothetical protein
MSILGAIPKATPQFTTIFTFKEISPKRDATLKSAGISPSPVTSKKACGASQNSPDWEAFFLSVQLAKKA